MELCRAYSASEIAGIIGARVIGMPDVQAKGINEIHVVRQGDIVFVDHAKYYKPTIASSASVIIINQACECPEGKALLIHPEPFDAFNLLTRHFLQELEKHSEPLKSIDPTAHIMPGAYLGKYVSIGKQSIIHPGVVIYDHCQIGDNVVIHANTVIGSDAFYFKRKTSHHEKLQSVGRVIIENDVEIGAACTIDRGVTGDTIIGAGTKMDNHVHVGHDTVIGHRCLFAAQVGIAGCVRIGDDVIMWGQAGCAANVSIGSGTIIYAQSGIAKSIEANQTYFGSPAVDARQKMREIAALAQLAKKK